MKVLLVWPNKDTFGYKPIGLALLSALLKQKGHEVRLFDTTFFDFGFTEHSAHLSRVRIFKPVDFGGLKVEKRRVDLEFELLKALDGFDPDVLAISALSDEVQIGLELARTAKRYNPRMVVVVGNKAVTMNPSVALRSPDVDYVCIGEGVNFAKEFIHFLEHGGDPAGISNLAWRDSEGNIQTNPLRPYYQDLDALPHLDWSIFDDRHFLKPYDGTVLRGGDHMICWGCANRCSYCINDSYRRLYGRNAGRFIRSYSVDRIIYELKTLKEIHKLEFYKFNDEDFCIKPIEYFRKLADSYSRNVSLPFAIMANAKNIDEEKCELLRNMGCASVSLGIETGNNRLRHEILHRTETVDDIVRATKLLNQAGIRTSSFNMLAIPFENRDTVMETIEVNRRAEVRYPNVVFFFPLEGTHLREVAVSNGFFDPQSETVFMQDEPALTLPGITRQSLMALQQRFALYVKLPRQFFPYIERSEMPDETGRRLTEALFAIFDRGVFLNDGYWDEGIDIPSHLNALEEILAAADATDTKQAEAI